MRTFGHKKWNKMYRHNYALHRNCGSGYPKPYIMLKQSSRHAIHGLWMLQCSMHTGLAHAPCILQNMRTEVAWRDEALSPSFMTCYSPDCCDHWRGRSMWQVTSNVNGNANNDIDRWNFLPCVSPIVLAIEWSVSVLVVAIEEGRLLLVFIFNSLSMSSLWTVFELKVTQESAK